MAHYSSFEDLEVYKLKEQINGSSGLIMDNIAEVLDEEEIKSLLCF